MEKTSINETSGLRMASPSEQEVTEQAAREQAATPLVDSAEELARLRESIDHARKDAERAHFLAESAHEDIRALQTELSDQQRARQHALIVVLVILIGACAYGFLALRSHELSLAALPRMHDSISRIESARREDHQQLAASNLDLATTSTASDDSVAETSQKTGGEVGGVEPQVAVNNRERDASQQLPERKRVDFVVSKERSNELAPGLAFTVQNIDVSRQAVDGYLRFLPEGRSVWLRQQRIFQPLLVRNVKNEPYELVFTRINPDGAAGYILLPSSHGGALQSARP
jgi:hypothetical protein